MMGMLNAVGSASSIPLSVAKLAWHAWRGKEDTTLQRLGLSSIKRSAGPLIWLHASTVAECAVALPVLFRCLLEYNDKVHIMLTVACADALKLLQGALPTRVILQMVPLDNPVSATMFMRHWRPQVGILMESPFLPSLVAAARRYGVKLALLNARMSTEDLLKWHTSRGRRRMLKQMVDSFSLIIPQSDMDVGHFRIFGTSTRIMPGWCSDLQHAAALASGVWQLWTPKEERVGSLQQKLAGRPCWLAAHTEAGEEEVVAELHAALAPHLPGLLTLVLPSGQERCAAVLEVFRGQGLATARWSDKPRSYSSLDVLLVDELEQLSLIYSVVEVVVMGGSLIPGRPPHNLTQAAVAGCALLLGPHAANGPAELMAEQLNAAAWAAAEEAAAAVQSAGQAMEDYSGNGNARMAGGSFSSPPRLRRSGSTAVTTSSARPSQHLHLLSGDDSFGDLAITTSVASDSCRSRGPAPGPHPPSQLHPHTPQRRGLPHGFTLAGTALNTTLRLRSFPHQQGLLAGEDSLSASSACPTPTQISSTGNLQCQLQQQGKQQWRWQQEQQLDQQQQQQQPLARLASSGSSAVQEGEGKQDLLPQCHLSSLTDEAGGVPLEQQQWFKAAGGSTEDGKEETGWTSPGASSSQSMVTPFWQRGPLQVTPGTVQALGDVEVGSDTPS
ncbi:3-deoxy-D-manno-octulosonic-acid transferase-domain-containing protein [Haematococcus lacustris]